LRNEVFATHPFHISRLFRCGGDEGTAKGTHRLVRPFNVCRNRPKYFHFFNFHISLLDSRMKEHLSTKLPHMDSKKEEAPFDASPD
jgi:hypothetical protein